MEGLFASESVFRRDEPESGTMENDKICHYKIIVKVRPYTNTILSNSASPSDLFSWLVKNTPVVQ